MEENIPICSFHIKKQVLRDKRYLVYHYKKETKEYPVDFDLLKKNSNYFYENQEQFKGKDRIELMNEKEEYVKLTDESIQAFISSIQNEPCSIKNSSIIPLQYLAHKYKFNELIQFTDQYIADHSEELVFAIISFKIDEMDERENNDSFFDTSKEEQIISNNLPKLIQKDEMLGLPIEIIYRILSLFYKHQTNKDEIKDDMTIFLFKCLDKYGRPASSLFNLIDFGEQRIEVVNRLFEKYPKKFDFNMINETLSKTVKELASEVTKQKEEYCKLYKEMKETFKEQLDELKEMKKQEEDKQKQNEIDNRKRINDFQTEFEKMKKQEEDKQKQNEIDNQKRINNFQAEVEKMTKEFEQKINFSQDQFKQICSKQEEFVDNFIVKKYHQIILETITVGQFRKFDDELKDHFKTEFVKIEQKNKEDLLCAKLVLDCISIHESYDNIPIIQIFKGDIKNIANIKITNDIIKSLKKEQLESLLTNCVNISNDLLVEIEYPCNNFEQIMKILSDFKSQKCQNMIISVTMNGKCCFEQKEFIENADVIKYNEIFLEAITVGQFRKFDDDKLKDHFLTELYKNENVQKNKNELLRAKLILDLSSIPESYYYKQIIDFLRKNENTQLEIKLTKDKVDDLYQKNQLYSYLTNCAIVFNDFIVEVEYPCNKFEQIMKIISDIKSQNDQKMKIFVTINDESYFEQKYEWDKCTEIVFEVQYPSSNFSNIYQKVIDLKQNNSEKVKVCIFYTQMEVADKNFKGNKEINYVRFDSNIKRTPNDGDDTSDGSFQSCKSLLEVSVPSSLIKIGNCTFSGCSELKKINFELPSSVTSIGNAAFIGCSSLTQITIPSSVISIGKNAFYNCSFSQITIPSSVTSIGDHAFRDCKSLTQITIPSSVKEIGDCVFFGCNKLDEISISASNEKRIEYIEDKYLVFKMKASSEIYDTLVFAKKSVNTVIIPTFINSVKGGAFEGCSSLTQITIPSSVTSIGNDAFWGCSSLTQVAIPSSITSIGNDAFRKCSSLTQITIPSSVTSIGQSAFYGCSFRQITIPSSVTSIGIYVFFECSSLTQITIPSSLTSISDYAFRDCSSLAQITIPSSVTSIGSGAFYYCKSLTQITIPSSVNSVGSGAFYQCTSLRRITIPSKINRSNLDIKNDVTINLI